MPLDEKTQKGISEIIDEVSTLITEADKGFIIILLRICITVMCLCAYENEEFLI